MMNLADVRDALLRSWWLVVLVTALAAGGALAYSQLATPTYESRVQLFVAAQGTDSDAAATYQGGLFTAQRVQSYLGVARSPTVTGPVVHDLGLRLTPNELARRITARAPPQTVLINIKVVDPSAEGAQRIAQAVGFEFIRRIHVLEQPSGSGESPVKLSVSVPASRPSGPVTPRTTLNVVAGMLLGLALGTLAAILRWLTDTRIKSPDELSARNLLLLGAVPADRIVERTPAVSLRESGLRSEALRQLRTSLRFVDPDDPPRTIVVTSAMPGEGKTTTACGLAMALAEAGIDVVLVEGDLRRPRIAAYLDLRPSEGVCGMLVNPGPLEDRLRVWSPPGGTGAMRVLPAGSIPPNPSELLGSRRMKGLLEELRECCDMVIVDAPPLLPVTDAAVLATEVDGVLLVARMRRVRRAELDRSLETLSRVRGRLLGVVANAVPRRDQQYDYEVPPVTGQMVQVPIAEPVSGAR